MAKTEQETTGEMHRCRGDQRKISALNQGAFARNQNTFFQCVGNP